MQQGEATITTACIDGKKMQYAYDYSNITPI